MPRGKALAKSTPARSTSYRLSAEGSGQLDPKAIDVLRDFSALTQTDRQLLNQFGDPFFCQTGCELQFEHQLGRVQS